MPDRSALVWRYLPQARSRLLAVAAALMAAFYAVVAVAFAAMVMREPIGLALAPLFGLLAWGMWKLSRFARWVTVIWIWVTVALMLLSVFVVGPGEGSFPRWGEVLVAITPLVAGGLFFVLVFGRHKREFKWP
ncbi:MAG TPA: hypothetical protein VHP55_08200 [Usitatibacter sp.]|nr:hypothetical protein [Usitatibacter sp.]